MHTRVPKSIPKALTLTLTHADIGGHHVHIPTTTISTSATRIWMSDTYEDTKNLGSDAENRDDSIDPEDADLDADIGTDNESPGLAAREYAYADEDYSPFSLP